MFKSRVDKLQKQIKEEKIDAVLISSVSNISYLTGFTNFSKKEREAYIFLGRDFAYIITDARYSEAVKRQVPHLMVFERGYKKPMNDLFKKHQIEVKRLGIEEENLTVAEYKNFGKYFKNIKHFNVSNLRSIKTKEEVNKIEKACEIGDLAFKFILKKIQTGITEKQVAGELENFIKGQDARLSFPPIIAFGKNSSVPHHQTGDTKLTGNGKCVLLDFGVKYDDYCSDMTRTVFFGKPTSKQKEIYRTVLAAQQKTVDFINTVIKTGKEIKAAEVDKVARDYIVSQPATPEVSSQSTSGVATYYPTIPHSLGHGIGLEVHEHPSLSPRSRDILKEGMVFSIEPGIYLTNFGGVRIEDLFVLEKQSLRQLTDSSKHLLVI